MSARHSKPGLLIVAAVMAHAAPAAAQRHDEWTCEPTSSVGSCPERDAPVARLNRLAVRARHLGDLPEAARRYDEIFGRSRWCDDVDLTSEAPNATGYRVYTDAYVTARRLKRTADALQCALAAYQIIPPRDASSPGQTTYMLATAVRLAQTRGVPLPEIMVDNMMFQGIDTLSDYLHEDAFYIEPSLRRYRSMPDRVRAVVRERVLGAPLVEAEVKGPFRSPKELCDALVPRTDYPSQACTLAELPAARVAVVTPWRPSPGAVISSDPCRHESVVTIRRGDEVWATLPKGISNEDLRECHMSGGGITTPTAPQTRDSIGAPSVHLVSYETYLSVGGDASFTSSGLETYVCRDDGAAPRCWFNARVSAVGSDIDPNTGDVNHWYRFEPLTPDLILRRLGLQPGQGGTPPARMTMEELLR